MHKRTSSINLMTLSNQFSTRKQFQRIPDSREPIEASFSFFQEHSLMTSRRYRRIGKVDYFRNAFCASPAGCTREEITKDTYTANVEDLLAVSLSVGPSRFAAYFLFCLKREKKGFIHKTSHAGVFCAPHS